MTAGNGHHQRRAGHERPEQLPHRDVEGDRRLLQHHVVGFESVPILHPAQTIGDGGMRDGDALG